jgi:predicted transcriptional regulator YdeE
VRPKAEALPRLQTDEVCLASSLPFECMEGMSKLKMPSMRYAIIKVSGDIHKVATAWDYPYRDWLINSAYEPEHAPALEVSWTKKARSIGRTLNWNYACRFGKRQR